MIMPNTLSRTLAAISPVDGTLRKTAMARLDNLTKPRGSLGRLEETAARLYCIADGQAPGVDPARIFTCAGDHGVTAEGVSPFPQEVTRQMVANFLAGGAGVNALARTAGVGLTVVDAGCAGGEFAPPPSLVSAKVMPGPANLAQGPARSVDPGQPAAETRTPLAGPAAPRPGDGRPGAAAVAGGWEVMRQGMPGWSRARRTLVWFPAL